MMSPTCSEVLNEVLSITAQESDVVIERGFTFLLNEVLSITAQE